MKYRTETFHRSEVLGNEACLMPARTYNDMHTLFQRCGESCLFIPIRSMQYMAVIDDEEVIFVDSMKKSLVEFSWQKFHPQSRSDLSNPVPYEFVHYDLRALETIKRAQSEFAKCVHLMMEKKHARQSQGSVDESIVPFRTSHGDEE